MEEKIRLTQYSHGAGCGCKIAPAVLDGILKSSGTEIFKDAKLLVGNESKDDAAVYDLGDGTAIISTTDFFMPIVDDPLEFGMIASVNAISDVYAMGGTPMMAIAILGWPIDKLSPEIAGKVIEGSKKICASCHIPLAGGHSIDAPEPIFGLAVTGRVPINNLKKNNTATEGCHLFLTKPLGVGVLTTAEKKGILKPQDIGLAANWMRKLNNAGALFGTLPYVKAMTDVTGFGLMGHLLEMCEGSGLQAELFYEKVPKLDEAELYILEGAVPGGTNRNWKSYGDKISLANENYRFLLADPQTSGGLLVAVEDGYQTAFCEQAKGFGLTLEPFGRLHKGELEKVIRVVS